MNGHSCTTLAENVWLLRAHDRDGKLGDDYWAVCTLVGLGEKAFYTGLLSIRPFGPKTFRAFLDYGRELGFRTAVWKRKDGRTIERRLD